MAESFYTILTNTGKAQIANASALGTKVNFTTLKLGDGNGSYYNPTETQTSLVREVWSGNIGNITVDSTNANWLVLETVIPADVGGFMIREAGVFDDQGNLLAVGKYPETYKPIVSQGSAKDLRIRIILEVTNTASVTLKVDPAVILATKKEVGDLSKLPDENLVAAIQADRSQLAENITQHNFLDQLKLKFIYGAKLDGITDDSVAVNNYINDVIANSGGRVLFPSGICKCGNIVIDTTKIESGEANLTFEGVGPSSVILNDSNDIFTFSGLSTSTDMSLRTSMKNINFKNLSFKSNNEQLSAITFNYCQGFRIENVNFDGFKGNGIGFNDTWDGEIVSSSFLNCGHASSDVDFNSSIEFVATYNNCNNIKFIGCWLETTPIFIRADTARMIDFINCKFEKNHSNTTNVRPLHLYNCKEFNFIGCKFINHTATFSTSTTPVDAGKHFMSILMDEKIKFIGCDFTTNESETSLWFNGVGTSFLNCTFDFTEGRNTYNVPFALSGDCEFEKCKIKLKVNSQTFSVGGSNNKIDAELYFYDSYTIPPINLSAGADYNKAKIEYQNMTVGATLQLVNPDISFSTNGIFHIAHNELEMKFATILTDTTATPVVYNCPTILKVNSASITDFNCGYIGQKVIIMALASVTITNNSSKIVLQGGTNKTLNIGQTATFILSDDNVWYEI